MISRSLVKPTVTPCTILLRWARVVPCEARTNFSSLSRVTTISLFSCVTLQVDGTASVSSPLGPLTFTSDAPSVIDTPAGMDMGFFPTRDMTKPSVPSLPDLAQHFAADAALAALDLSLIHISEPTRLL